MSKESKALEKKASQAWTSKRVFDMILNNALIIIMVIAVIHRDPQPQLHPQGIHY